MFTVSAIKKERIECLSMEWNYVFNFVNLTFKVTI